MNWIETVTVLCQLVLLIWFFGCIRTYRIGRILLVEGMGIKSAEFVMLCLFSSGAASFWCCPLWGKWYLLGVLVLWAIVQFFCHWYYTVFGVSERKLKGYNECFRNTLHLIPANETKLIPDLYHMILHLLILLNMGFAIYSIIK